MNDLDYESKRVEVADPFLIQINVVWKLVFTKDVKAIWTIGNHGRKAFRIELLEE